MALIKSIQKYRIRFAVVILIIQWPFKRFHFRYRDLKVLGFGVYSWLQLVDIVSRHDTSEAYEI